MSENPENPHAHKLGHPITLHTLTPSDLTSPPHAPEDWIARVYRQELSGVVLRGALSAAEAAGAAARLSGLDAEAWGSPNRGMRGGELRTIGDAATPCFTAFTGPTPERYREGVAGLVGRYAGLLGGALGADPVARVSGLLSALAGGRPAAPPAYVTTAGGAGEAQAQAQAQAQTWLPFNLRALDPGTQIYSHHDAHYRLPVYAGLGEEYSRHTALSWFITLQRPEAGGVLTLYGLWGSDPNPPMLPTRFVDTAALERDYLKREVALEAGDLVVFDSGRFVHRVTAVEGQRPRLTLGGFLTERLDGGGLGYWS